MKSSSNPEIYEENINHTKPLFKQEKVEIKPKIKAEPYLIFKKEYLEQHPNLNPHEAEHVNILIK